MPHNFEEFILKYQKLPLGVKAFIDSEEIGIFSDKLIRDFNLSIETKASLIVMISNLVLNIMPKESLGNNLIQLGIGFEDSHKIYTAVVTFLTEKGVLIEGNIPTKAPPVPQKQNQEVEIKKPEIPATVVRTMSHDMATIRPGSETVYRAASQADILNKDLPTQPVSDTTPRWESDSTR